MGPTGASGAFGPGLVFGGSYNPVAVYNDSAYARSVVLYSGVYYLANNPSKDGQATWGVPTGSDWTAFGTQFSAIATGLLLAQSATITQTLTLGQAGTNTGRFQSANFSPGAAGFYMDATGYAEFNNMRIRGQLIAGQIAVGAVAFNPDPNWYPENTFPLQIQVSNTDGTHRTNLNSSPAFIQLVTLFGSAYGGHNQGFRTDIYGKSTMTFLCVGSGDYSVTSGQNADTNIVYSTDNGATWNNVTPWQIISDNSVHSFNVVGSVTVSGLAPDGTIIFGLRAAATDNSTTYNVGTVTVIALNT